MIDLIYRANKRPPHHLQPLDALESHMEDDNEQHQQRSPTSHQHQTITLNLKDLADPNTKISIPIDTSRVDMSGGGGGGGGVSVAPGAGGHINLDINLRLVDFFGDKVIAANSTNNRSYDDLNAAASGDKSGGAGPMRRQLLEKKMSRSLPGSSGSLNKHKPLPPLNRAAGGLSLLSTSSHPPHPSHSQHHYHQQQQQHQQAHHHPAYVNPMTMPTTRANYAGTSPHQDKQRPSYMDHHDSKYEDSYLAQLQKAHAKPVIKTYSLKDYRNFVKDAMPIGTDSNGKLGFDFDNEAYKQKVAIKCFLFVFMCIYVSNLH